MKNSKRYAPPDGYLERTSKTPPRELLTKAVDFTKNWTQKTALDLGCGAGTETSYLLDHGFHVTAVDGNSDSAAYINALSRQNDAQFVHSDFEDFRFETYNFVNASFSLPFAHKNSFLDIVQSIKDSLTPGGIFTGELFGDQDEWNKPGESMTFVTKDLVLELFSDMKMLYFREKDQQGTIADGKPKHWHLFEIIVQKI